MKSSKTHPVFGTPYESSRTEDDESYHGTRSVASKRLSLDQGRSQSPSDNGLIQVGQDGIEVALVLDFRDEDLEAIGRWAQAASVGAPEGVRASEDPAEFLRGGLAKQSLEDIRVAFAVRGVSRVLTHQLVRTRQAAFKQQSQRDCWYGNLPEFRIPESVWVNPEVRDSWINALISCHTAYNNAVGADVPYEDARYILPEGTTNFILCEYSLRTFIETYNYRGCVMFQDEYVWTIRAMRDLLVARHPYLEPHIKISCETARKCTYQGRERVEETCTFPWAREDNRVFVPSRYLGEEAREPEEAR
jgi:Thymidylate synthase complementing protein